ncbi:MAG: hypothetical protein JWM46_127 [Candidatus Kaiserbacteria bacterium]|nr:hypothetical protein [Candidatus Kaiserbacteria bacterium]
MPETAANCFERLRLAALEEQNKLEIGRWANAAILKGILAAECGKLKTHCAGLDIPDEQVAFVEGEVAKLEHILWQGGRDKAVDDLVKVIRGFSDPSTMKQAAE